MWCSFCDNKEALERLYDSTEDLDLVELHEIVLHRDGPRLQLRFDLARFPDRPASRWSPGDNTLQVQVSAWGVESLHLDGWSLQAKGVLALEEDEGGRRLTFRAPGVVLAASFQLLRIDRFSPYCSDAPPA